MSPAYILLPQWRSKLIEARFSDTSDICIHHIWWLKEDDYVKYAFQCKNGNLVLLLNCNAKTGCDKFTLGLHADFYTSCLLILFACCACWFYACFVCRFACLLIYMRFLLADFMLDDLHACWFYACCYICLYRLLICMLANFYVGLIADCQCLFCLLISMLSDFYCLFCLPISIACFACPACLFPCLLSLLISIVACWS